jgi:16S rRNA processing protein RimM
VRLRVAGEELVVLGRITGLYGIRGWVKVRSETEPRENILAYERWYLEAGNEWIEARVQDGRRHGKGLVAKVVGIDDRDQAGRLRDALIAVRREQLPDLPPGEYYWADLVGLRVSNLDGVELGRVDHLIDTGSNDVLVLLGDRERLVPYLPGSVVKTIDLAGGKMIVDWDADY